MTQTCKLAWQIKLSSKVVKYKSQEYLRPFAFYMPENFGWIDNGLANDNSLEPDTSKSEFLA